MSKTTNPILVEDFYIATSLTDLSDSWDLEITVNTPPSNTKWFIIVDPNSQANRERMYYHNVIGNTIYVRAINRVNPKQHYAQDKIQINDTSLIFNYLSKLQSTTFYVEQTALLEVKIWGWPVLVWINTISVEDTTLAMTNTATNYIYYKTTTNEIKTTTVEANATTDKWIIVAEVTAVAWSITTINYRHHELMSWNTIDSIVLTSMAWLVDTYTITYTDWTTSTFNITNWNWIASIALFATSPDWLTKTYKITFTNWNTFNYDVLDWNAITSVDYTSSTPNWLIDTYTITFQDWTSTTFNITNWNAITSVAYTSSTPDWLVDTYTINFQDWTSTTFDVTNWNSIVSVNYTSSLWLVDTYTITFQDWTTTTFEITNWADWVSVWGSITWTLADQTDLINALNAKLSLAWWAMTWLLQEKKSNDIASATTTNLATANWNTVHITWTTTITWFWTLQAWAKFTLIFDWILTLTHNATSLILPTGADIITATWDTCEIRSEWSGNWIVTSYQRKNWWALLWWVQQSLISDLIAWEDLITWDLVYQNTTTWEVFKIVSNDITKIKFTWIVKTWALLWNTVPIITWWVAEWFSWLTIWKDYYLWNRFINVVNWDNVVQSTWSETWIDWYFWMATAWNIIRTWQEFLTTDDFLLRNIKIDLLKVWSPTSIISMWLWKANNKTLAAKIATSSNNYTWTDLTTSYTEKTFNFWDLELEPNTLYFYWLYVNTWDNTNHYKTAYWIWNTYPDWLPYRDTTKWDNWTTLTNDKKFNVQLWTWTAVQYNETWNIKVWEWVDEDKMLINKLDKSNDQVIATRDLSVATWVVTYNHNLWRKPDFINITWLYYSWSAWCISKWKYDKWSNSCIYMVIDSTSWNSTSYSLFLWSSLSVYQSWIIQNITETTFDVSYTKVWSPTWVAQLFFDLF